MRIINKAIYISILLLGIISTSQAASLYVTDRILLGVHLQASEDSPILKSVASGTAVQLLEKRDNFTRVKLPDGTEGWVSSQYLMNEQPATAQYDKLLSDFSKNKQSLDSVSETLRKREREVQVLRDELSNAKTTIREAQKKGGVVSQPDPQLQEKLQQAEQQIEALNKALQAAKQETATTSTANELEASLKYAEEENAALQARIALALANLSGEKAPSPEELAGIRPRFPLWYWALMLVALAIGIGVGISWMDYQARKRHGGFRV